MQLADDSPQEVLTSVAWLICHHQSFGVGTVLNEGTKKTDGHEGDRLGEGAVWNIRAKFYELYQSH
jgi:hypothetical protein